MVSLCGGGESPNISEVKPNPRLMWVLVQPIDPAGIERRRTALDAVNDIALLEQKIRKVGAILSGDAGNEGDFFRHGALGLYG